MRELDNLKTSADYQSCDPSKLADWLKQIGAAYKRYAYPMVKCGVDRSTLPSLADEHLQADCGVTNGVHRLKILQHAKRKSD